MQVVRRLAAKPLVVMPLVAGLGLGAWWGLRSDDGADSSTAGAADQVVEATTGPMALTVSAEGTVAAAEIDDLSFTSAGTVTAVNVSAGDVVQAGQVLATIDSAELEAAVADAEADVADAEAALADDEDAGASDEQIGADQSRLTSAQDGLASAQEQLAGGQLVASFDGTVASVDITVGEELASGGAGGTALTGSDTGTGQSAGTIGESDTQGLPTSTEQETSATPHIQVVSAGRFTVELGFDDTDIEQLDVGQTATVSLSTASSTTGFGLPGGGAFPGGGGFPGGGSAPGGGGFPGGGTFPGGGEPSAQGDGGSGEDEAPTEAGAVPGGAEAAGEVTEVGAMADASSGVASYPVTVAFTDDSGDHNVGATVMVEITYDEREDVVQVPAMAVTTADGTSTVTVRSDDGDEESAVDTGLTSGSMVEITSGLEAGEQVVVTVPGARGGGGPDGGPPAFSAGSDSEEAP
jgi:multidrug efflux pump subunit AcrA (membrane-fusion protein)